MTNNKLKFPYSISDFYKLITNNYFYVDRTNYIPLLEEEWTYPLFLRPRRFGKSLLLSMLKNYYDINKADEFERLFGHLAIGQNPTPNHNQYMVMDWDFSMVSSQESIQSIQQNLYDHINQRVWAFMHDYNLKDKVTITPKNALASIESLLTAVRETGHKLYLLIDEYDNFANDVLMARTKDNKDRYQALVSGEGCLKGVFKLIKGLTKGGGIDRVFITGVSPIAMSDVTSGFNIAEDIYLLTEFNNLCGFTQADVNNIVTQVVTECGFPPDKVAEVLDIMKTFYNGYAFTYNKPPLIYNPTLTLYFIKYFQRQCDYPPNMLDQNLSTDRNKLLYISGLSNGEQVISKALNKEQPLSIPQFADRFGVADMLSQEQGEPFMTSLLYFLGMLTMGGRDYKGKIILQIPNLVARKLYLERLQDILLENHNKNQVLIVAEDFYSTGNIQALCEFIEQTYFSIFDNRDYQWTKELNIKTLFLMVLYNDAQYVMHSEMPIQRGYADLVMLIRPDMRQYQLLDFLFEFKYISLAELELSGAELREMSEADLTALDLVKKAQSKAETQLKNYQNSLQQTHNNSLKLQTFSVVALGYERLLWQEIT